MSNCRKILITILLCCGSLQAESPNDFYSNDYAKTPLEKPAPWNNTESQAVPEPVDKDAPTREPSEYDQLIDAATTRLYPDQSLPVQDEPEIENNDFLLEARPGTPIESLGAIIDGHDSAHFDSSMKEFMAVINSHDLTIGKLHLVGAPKSEIFAEILGGLAFRGGSVNILGYVPDKYPVKNSPTWIVSTKEGEIILEGVDSLAKFFNARGEFIDPSIQKETP